MTSIDSKTGTVLITSQPAVGRALALDLAGRAKADCPGLLLLGRPSDRLNDITETARAGGAIVEALGSHQQALGKAALAAT